MRLIRKRWPGKTTKPGPRVIGSRARFCYEDLPELWSCSDSARWGYARCGPKIVPLPLGEGLCLLGGRMGIRFALRKIAFFIAGLEYPAILHHHAQLSGKTQGAKQTLHRRRQHLS